NVNESDGEGDNSDYDSEDGADDGDADQSVPKGNAVIFSPNMESSQNKCIGPGEYFCVLSFDFEIENLQITDQTTVQEIDAMKKANSWTTKHPDIVLWQLRSAKKEYKKKKNGMARYYTELRQLDKALNGLVNEVYLRLGQLYPYEVTPKTCNAVSTVFCAKYIELTEYLKDCKKYIKHELPKRKPRQANDKKRRNRHCTEYPDIIVSYQTFSFSLLIIFKVVF